MGDLSYRVDAGEKTVREALVGALRPETRELLRQACDSAGQLASARPPVWVGRPASWLLAAGASVALLTAPLVGSFGRLEPHPFASQGGEPLLLIAACFAGLVLGAFALRSRALRRGGLPTGVYLFASGLVEIGDGRVRVWPLSQLRSIGVGRLAEVDLGGAGHLRLTSGSADLAGTLEASCHRLDLAEATRDLETIARLDPLVLERDRSASWRAIAGPTRLLEADPPSPERVKGREVLGALCALGLSVVGALVPRMASDAVGIRRAVQQQDTRSLIAYVERGGLLDGRADRAWLALAAQEESDEPLITYLHETESRSSGHRPDDAARLLAHRALRRASRVESDETPSRVELPAAEPNDRLDLDPVSLDEAADGLARYLSLRPLERPLRALVDRRLFELRLAQSRVLACAPASGQRDRDPLADYLPLDSAQGEEAHAARWKQATGQAAMCGSLGDLEELRAMVRTTEDRVAFEATWQAFFAARRVETARLKKRALVANDLSQHVLEQLDTLWQYLASHPETRTQARSSFRRYALSGEAGWGTSWGALMMAEHNVPSRLLLANMKPEFLRELSSDTLDGKSLQDGPHLLIQWIDSTDDEHDQFMVTTLSLPGNPPITTRNSFNYICPPNQHLDKRRWECVSP